MTNIDKIISEIANAGVLVQFPSEVSGPVGMVEFAVVESIIRKHTEGMVLVPEEPNFPRFDMRVQTRIEPPHYPASTAEA